MLFFGKEVVRKERSDGIANAVPARLRKAERQHRTVVLAPSALAAGKKFTLPANKKSKRLLASFGGKRWIRTTEVGDNRFTVCSLWPLGNLPIFWSW